MWLPPIRKVVCIGAGYVGGPTSAVIAKQCPHLEVVVLDICKERIDAFNSDHLPIYEPDLHELVMECRGRNLFFSTDMATCIREADLILVSVNTPTKRFGIGAGAAADLSRWEAAGRTIAEHAVGSTIVVEKSTVPVRTAAALQRVLSTNRRQDASFDVLSNPEFLAEGTAINDLLYPDRILLGYDLHSRTGKNAMERLAEIYAHWVPTERILKMDIWSAELSKLTANAFLAQRISSINAVSHLCEKSGANISEVARAIGMDSRIGGHFLRASVGFGGSCFKKDILSLVYICESFGLHEVAQYWLEVVKMNEYNKSRFVSRMLHGMMNTVRDKKVAVFGFAFKKDTADVRETPALDVCLGLLAEGALVCVYDPKVQLTQALWELNEQRKTLEESWKDHFRFEETPEAAVEGADAIAVLTEWDVFKTYDYRKFYQLMRKPASIFDGRLILDDVELANIGFDVRSVGRAHVPALSESRSEDLGSTPCFSHFRSSAVPFSDIM